MPQNLTLSSSWIWRFKWDLLILSGRIKIITQSLQVTFYTTIIMLFSHHDFTRFFLQFGFGVEIFSWNFEIVVLKTNFWVFWRNWADDKQTSWITALWWLSVSLWRIYITFVWPSRIFCIDKTVPGTKPPEGYNLLRRRSFLSISVQPGLN